MPCYEVNTMSVEFKAKYKDILMESLKRLGYKPREFENLIMADEFTFDLNKSKVNLPENWQGRLNAVKRKYSEVVLEAVAKKRRWVLKNKTDGNFQLLKY